MSRKLFNEALLQVINILAIDLGEKTRPFLTAGGQSAVLRLGDTSLVEITSSDISVLGDSSLGENIIPSDHIQTDRAINPNDFAGFIKESSLSLIRLNHLGMGYKVPDIEKEIEKIGKLVETHPNIHLYEEASSTSGQRWFFLGDKQNWEGPMFEIVLTQSSQIHDHWNPHFQVDLDTSLSIEELKQITEKVFRPKFLAWELDIPTVGTVCAMGVLGDINGTKITLGLGTKQRNNQFFRTNILKEII